jgi:hypothetical protein
MWRERPFKIYGDSGKALSAKGTALLGRLGGMPQAAEATAAAQGAPRTAEPRMIEFEGRDDPAAGTDEKKNVPNPRRPGDKDLS